MLSINRQVLESGRTVDVVLTELNLIGKRSRSLGQLHASATGRVPCAVGVALWSGICTQASYPPSQLERNVADQEHALREVQIRTDGSSLVRFHQS